MYIQIDLLKSGVNGLVVSVFRSVWLVLQFLLVQKKPAGI